MTQNFQSNTTIKQSLSVSYSGKKYHIKDKLLQVGIILQSLSKMGDANSNNPHIHNVNQYLDNNPRGIHKLQAKLNI